MIMIKRRIYYLLLLGGCFGLIMLYNYEGLRFLLCCLIFIPLLCLLLLIPAAFSCRVSLDMGGQTMTRGEDTDFSMTVYNKGLLPVSGVHVCVSWMAPGEKKVKAKSRLQGLGRKERAELILELSAEHCGMAQLRVTKLYICDYLGLFSLPLFFPKKNQLNKEFGVLPRVTPILKEEAACFSQCPPEPSGEGDVLLRDYRQGDSLHRIYWKLSVRTQELQIRDFEHSGQVALFLDFAPELKNTAELWDAYLDRACSLLYFLVQEGALNNRLVEVAWRGEEGIVKEELTGEGALQAWMEDFLLGKSKGVVVREDAAFEEKLVFRLKEDCRLYYGEQSI